jgi:hypothetical protein
VGLLLRRTLNEVEAELRGIYMQHTSLLHFLELAKVPQPPALRFVAEFVTMDNLYQALERDPVQLEEVRGLLATIEAEGLSLDAEKLGFLATARARDALLKAQSTTRMARAAGKARLESSEAAEAAGQALEHAIAVVEAVRLLPVELNLWQAQNLWYQIWQESKAQKLTGDESYGPSLRCLGGLMDLAVDDLVVEAAVTA